MQKNRWYILGIALLLACAPVFAGGGTDAKSLAKQTADLAKQAAKLQKEAADIEETAAYLSAKNRRVYQEELASLGFAPPQGLFNDAADLLTGAPPEETKDTSAKAKAKESATTAKAGNTKAKESSTTAKAGSTKESGNTGGAGFVSVANTSGRLTINGLSKYNGKWIYVIVTNVDDGVDVSLLAADSVTKDVVTGVKITNGSATLKAWKHTKVNDKSSRLENYSGSDKGLVGGVIIANKATITYADSESMTGPITRANAPNWLSAGGAIMSVDFARGKATCTPSMIMDY